MDNCNCQPNQVLSPELYEYMMTHAVPKVGRIAWQEDEPTCQMLYAQPKFS